LTVSRFNPMRIEQAAGVIAARVFAGALGRAAAVQFAVLRCAPLFLAPRGSFADSPQVDDIAHVGIFT
jgi:hypothetical protein